MFSRKLTTKFLTNVKILQNRKEKEGEIYERKNEDSMCKLIDVDADFRMKLRDIDKEK